MLNMHSHRLERAPPLLKKFNDMKENFKNGLFKLGMKSGFVVTVCLFMYAVSTFLLLFYCFYCILLFRFLV